MIVYILFMKGALKDLMNAFFQNHYRLWDSMADFSNFGDTDSYVVELIITLEF